MANRTIDLGNNEKRSKGVFDNEDGTFTAMTFSKSKTFKSKKAAEKWFKRMTESVSERLRQRIHSSGETSVEVSDHILELAGLRPKFVLTEKKGKNYTQAMDELMTYLEGKGWTVKRGLKVPYATRKDGDLRLWFKKQAVWFTHVDSYNQKHDYKDARTISYDLDVRKIDFDKLLAFLDKRFK